MIERKIKQEIVTTHTKTGKCDQSLTQNSMPKRKTAWNCVIERKKKTHNNHIGYKINWWTTEMNKTYGNTDKKPFVFVFACVYFVCLFKFVVLLQQWLCVFLTWQQLFLDFVHYLFMTPCAKSATVISMHAEFEVS